jgi:hypothetical protein
VMDSKAKLRKTFVQPVCRLTVGRWGAGHAMGMRVRMGRATQHGQIMPGFLSARDRLRSVSSTRFADL